MPGQLSTLTKRHPLHLQIALLFTLLIVAIGSVIIIFSHRQLTQLSELSANRQYQKTAEAVAAELNGVTRTMKMSVNMLTGMSVVDAKDTDGRLASVGKLIEILRQNDYASSVYIGYTNGDFFMLRRITGANRAFFGVPENVSWLVQSSQLQGVRPEKRFIELNDAAQIVADKPVANDSFDPRTRTWFVEAKNDAAPIASPIYTFKGTGEKGLTFSRRSETGNAVIGLDVSLASLSEFLTRQALPPGSRAIVTNAAREIIASLPQSDAKNEAGHAVLTTLLTRHKTGQTTNTIFEADGQEWHGSVLDIDHNGNSFQLAIATPSVFLTAAADSLRNASTLIACLLLLLSLPVVWFFSLKISRPLEHLRRDAEAISNLIFEEGESRPSVIAEVDDLRQAMAKMKRTLNQFISIGSTLSAKDNMPQQMQALLNETTDIAGMDGGMIFLADKNKATFSPTAILLADKNISSSELGALEYRPDECANFWQIRDGQPVAGEYRSGCLPGELSAFFGSAAPRFYFAVPMQTYDGQLLGFQLLFSFREMSAGRQQAKLQLANSLVGSLSVAIEMQYLLQEQKNLLNAFIELIAGAIDAKSTYTGGHCQRVPEITKMLAKAAVEAKEGPFSSFTLSANEWEELHTACWLHDCGKITTPEFVVDKATKLEQIYDRIHEVRMRFETLKREKEIGYLRDMLPHMPAELEASLAQELRQLDDDFYFIAQCNIGNEFMSDEALARIKTIAEYRWTRTLDDTAGVSSAENARKSRRASPELPVQECILADKDEHIIPRESTNHLPESYHFKLSEPTHLYNYGEIYNLSIRRGTLNDEERYKINEHIMQTIIMLRKLPFPRTMANVPTLAGGHHERMDGKGYPYQLRDEQMSIPVKMMAIADVFEALTAGDRPYKSAKRLSEALNIMAAMVNERHLNRDLFVLFLESGVWHDYAAAYLQPDKIDAVDVSGLMLRLVA
jgi:HD-GYP domain-containing protein (c-di-GMP phosphodiesterase class II)/cell division protein FtsL